MRWWMALLLFGCAGQIDDPARFQDAELCDLDVQEDILAPRCARGGCHVPSSPTGGIEYLSSGLAQRLVGVESTTCGGALRIDPADPEASHLLVRLSPMPRCGTMPIDPMPLAGGRLTDRELACVRAWVISLAENGP
jgi:hypothetical protein